MRLMILVLVTASVVQAQSSLFSRPVATYASSPWGWPSWSTLVVTVNVAPGNGGVTFPSGRIIEDVRVGGPTGSVITAGLGPAGPAMMLAAGETALGQWVIPANTPAGSYWMRVRYTDSAGVTYDEFAVGQVFDTSGGAYLLPTSTPTLGGTAAFDISDTTTSAAGAPYQTACSITSNSGILFNGDRVALDMDALFLASWPSPPAAFTNFSGMLDSTGLASLSLAVPNDPSLSGTPFRIQAVVLDAMTGPRLSSPNGYIIP